MSHLQDRDHLLGDQYRDSSALSARANIHRFSTNPVPWFRWVFDQFDLPDECRMLELGCGTGAIWASSLGRIRPGWSVVLTDLSPGMVEEAMAALGADGRFRFETADAQSLSFDDRSFDAVVANHMLYHVEDRRKALSEIGRVLKPGGRLYATTVGRGHMRELWDLAACLAPGVGWSHEEPAEEFGLENGARQLAEWFEDVELRVYEDALVVPEPEPIVGYLLSVFAEPPLALQGERRAEFARALRDALPLRITKSVGLFVAR